MPDGVAIGAHAARNLVAAGLSVVAVVKLGDFPLADMLEQEGCDVTMFSDAARGMGASLAHGVAQRRSADATIAAIAQELQAGRELVAPAYQGQRGHPVGLGKRFGAQLAALGGDAGARDIIAAHKNELVLIECDDPGVLQDIDRREDLTK